MRWNELLLHSVTSNNIGERGFCHLTTCGRVLKGYTLGGYLGGDASQACWDTSVSLSEGILLRIKQRMKWKVGC